MLSDLALSSKSRGSVVDLLIFRAVLGLMMKAGMVLDVERDSVDELTIPHLGRWRVSKVALARREMDK